MESRQRGPIPELPRKSGPIEGHVGQVHPLHIALPEDEHILGPDGSGVEAPRPIKIVVPRGDDHRGGDAPQSGGQSLGGLPVGLSGIQKVPGQHHQIGPPLNGGVRQLVQQQPLLRPSLPGLLQPQSGEGRVQMKVGGV